MKPKSKKKVFVVHLFGGPTKENFCYWLKEARKAGVSNKQFENAWFKGIEKEQRQNAEYLFEKRKPFLAQIIAEHGNEEQKKQVYNWAMKKLKEWADKEGIDLSFTKKDKGK